MRGLKSGDGRWGIKTRARDVTNLVVKGIQLSIRIRRIVARPITRIRNSVLLWKVVKPLRQGSNSWKSERRASEFGIVREKYAVDFKKLITNFDVRSIGLIACEKDAGIENFVRACAVLDIRGEVFDPCRARFLKAIMESDISTFLCRPSNRTTCIRLMFKEKIGALLSCRKDLKVFPSCVELQIYESKRELAYFLEMNEIPHPKTHVFYHKNEAEQFVESCNYPRVFKTSNGSGSRGVEIVYNKRQAKRLIRHLFDVYYINKVVTDYRDIDYGYVFFQEFIEDVREFRVIKIGDSWFGHEKRRGSNSIFMSGSGVNDWTRPPFSLLDFCSELAERFGFSTICFDVFLDKKGNYLVNELQAWFGSYNPSQMYIDDVPGRYVRRNGRWVFEPGMFNEFGSMALRLVSVLNESGGKCE